MVAWSATNHCDCADGEAIHTGGLVHCQLPVGENSFHAAESAVCARILSAPYSHDTGDTHYLFIEAIIISRPS